MRTKSIIGSVAVLAGVAGTFAFTAGCSFDPLKYASRNACEFVNCESLFFVEDLFPLSAGPEAGGEAPPAEEAGGGGH
jgi:hypothetical protein